MLKGSLNLERSLFPLDDKAVGTYQRIFPCKIMDKDGKVLRVIQPEDMDKDGQITKRSNNPFYTNKRYVPTL